jgi:hypothetical protein
VREKSAGWRSALRENVVERIVGSVLFGDEAASSVARVKALNAV